MNRIRWICLLFSMGIVGLFLFEVAAKLPFGNPAASQMDDYFIRNTQVDTGGNNAVTAIVFDYRGFDTLGEATVLFTAVLGVSLILRQAAKRRSDENG